MRSMGAFANLMKLWKTEGVSDPAAGRSSGLEVGQNNDLDQEIVKQQQAGVECLGLWREMLNLQAV